MFSQPLSPRKKYNSKEKRWTFQKLVLNNQSFNFSPTLAFLLTVLALDARVYGPQNFFTKFFNDVIKNFKTNYFECPLVSHQPGGTSKAKFSNLIVVHAGNTHGYDRAKSLV